MVLLVDKIQVTANKDEEKTHPGGGIKENYLNVYGRSQVAHKPTNSGKKKKSIIID